MTNLLQETIEILKEENKSLDDIIWYGTTKYQLPIESLKTLFDVKYDSSYGANEIPLDLIAVGKDFWLERHEYDGAEWWEYKSFPKKPKGTIKIKKLTTEALFPKMEDCIQENKEINND